MLHVVMPVVIYFFGWALLAPSAMTAVAQGYEPWTIKGSLTYLARIALPLLS